MALEKTWRWFGTGDKITLNEIRQVGVEGIVTSLHHIPKGNVWEKTEILKMKKEIQEKGMRWSVAESLPVHEAIKYGGHEREQLIDNYIASVKNLGACGIDTVCYNFMPVIDWIRTDLHFKLPDGSESLYFDLAKFVAFEIFILKREGAENDYPSDVVERALAWGRQMSEKEKNDLVDTIIVKTQGFIDGISVDGENDPVQIFRNLISAYRGIDKNQLRANLKYFLELVIPEAEKAGVRFAIHPDDPPRPVLGLPRIVSTLEDLKWILECVESPANGSTFCSGSLCVNPDNDLPEIVRQLKDRIYFVHLRNTELLENLDFYESGHLTGRADMFEILQLLLKEQKFRQSTGRNDAVLPMRVDHGLRMLSDFQHDYNPGYPLAGRMKGLAEISGMENAIERMVSQAPDF